MFLILNQISLSKFYHAVDTGVLDKNKLVTAGVLITVMDFDEKMSSSPKLSRLRLPKQVSVGSVGSSMSQGKVSRMTTIRSTLRNTVRKKRNPQTKIFLKRNEFLQYSTRHIKELETALDYFREGFLKK